MTCHMTSGDESGDRLPFRIFCGDNRQQPPTTSDNLHLSGYSPPLVLLCIVALEAGQGYALAHLEPWTLSTSPLAALHMKGHSNPLGPCGR